MHGESLDCRRGQIRVWHGYRWAEPSLAVACVTQGALQIDFGSSPFAECQGPVRVKEGGDSEWGGQNLAGVGQERGF